MQVLGFFATTALLLAGIGIYDVMAYFISQRGREIGVRMALGAERSDMLRLVVRQGMALAMIGVAAGFLTALAMTRLISGLLFGVGANDPLTLAIFSPLLAAVAFAANYIPATRGHCRSYDGAALRMRVEETIPLMTCARRLIVGGSITPDFTLRRA